MEGQNRIRDRCETQNNPRIWEEVGVVDQLLIYPLKSSKAIPLKSADATSTGLREGNLADRSFMTINEKNQFITGREAKLLVTLKTKFVNNTLTVTALDGTSASVNVIELCRGNPEITRFKIRGDDVQGIDCGKEMSDFISRVVYNNEKKLRLVYTGIDEFQRAKRNYGFFDFPMFQENDTISSRQVASRNC
ncbi:Mitochondrial amidoxime-reducing component 1 [Armadillidium vulgare]|nr:Mitochondrial amidoxime-reducing component 1 [Armadillidium vulgare]